ncbi:Endonuclease/exonuclease/phosphatase [Aspergillus oleicola]
MIELRIAQYNVHNIRKTMTLLSASEHAHQYDMIAIQEPAKQKNKFATFCESNSSFQPLYPLDRYARVCFLLNKRIPSYSWDIEHVCQDAAILILHANNTTLTVTNIYNECHPASSINPQSPIWGLEDIFTRPGEHILLGDMDLHHPSWSTKTTRPDKMAEELLNITGGAGLALMTPRDMVTWRKTPDSNLTSTLDLTFVSEHLKQLVERCESDGLLHHSSDHMPISILITLPGWGATNPGCQERHGEEQILTWLELAANTCGCPMASPREVQLINSQHIYATSRWTWQSRPHPT